MYLILGVFVLVKNGFFFFFLFLGIVIGKSVTRKVLRVNELFQKSETAKFQSLEVKVNV